MEKQANLQPLPTATLAFGVWEVVVLDDPHTLHTLVWVQMLSMMKGALPAGVREEIRLPQTASFSALLWDI